MSLTAYPTLRLKLTMPQALKLQFLPAVPGSNASAAADRAEQAAQDAQNAANTAVAATANKVDKSGDVMTGFLTLNANPVSALQAAPKQYVDAQISAGGITPQLPVLGGNLAGFTDTTGHVLREVKVGATMTIDGTGTLNTMAGGGNVMAVNAPAAGQIAQWTSGVQIEGIAGARGDVLYRGASKWLSLPAGTSGQFLRTQGAGADPVWAASVGIVDGDKGDITVSGGGATWTIDNDVVTYAKMQNISAASVLLGRGSAAGAGDPQEITLGTGLSMTGTTLASTATGGTAFTASSTAPVAPNPGDHWYDLSNGVLSIRINDGNSSQWVMVSPSGVDLSTTVRTDIAQSLTATQQTQGRSNIYAAPFDALAYSGMQINGSMEVSQELGTTGTNVSGGFPCDGWRNFRAGTMLTSAFTGLGALTSGLPSQLFVTVNTAQASLGAGDFALIQHAIEGYRISRLGWGTAQAQPITIAFWSSHQRPGLYSGTIRNSPVVRSYAFSYTQVASGVPQYNVITIPGDTAGTWPADNNIGLILIFCNGAGTTLTAPSANSWLAGNYLAAPGQVNGVAATSDVFRISGVIVLPGLEAPSAARSPLIMRPFDQELLTCQRYYSKSFGSGINPANGTANPGTYVGVIYSVNNLFTQRIFFPARMRAAPTMVFYSPATGTPANGLWQYFTGSAYVSSTTTVNTALETHFSLDMTTNASTIGQAFFVSGGWAADARL